MIQGRFLLLLCIVAVTVGAATAQTCKANVAAATNFNASQFAATWYEVGKISAAPGREGTCETAKYTANPDGTLTVELSWVDTKSAKRKLTGKMKNVGTKSTDAKLSVQFGKKPALIYTIFYLAYDTFFAVYACISDKAYVWVFSKTQEVSDARAINIKTIISNHYPDPSLFKLTKRNGCAA